MTYDCTDCIHMEHIRSGKVECPIGGIVEPLDGKYPYANDCPHYNDGRHTAEERAPCPKCGHIPIEVLSSKGYQIKCTACEHTVRAEDRVRAIEKWSTGGAE